MAKGNGAQWAVDATKAGLEDTTLVDRDRLVNDEYTSAYHIV